MKRSFHMDNIYNFPSKKKIVSKKEGLLRCGFAGNARETHSSISPPLRKTTTEIVDEPNDPNRSVSGCIHPNGKWKASASTAMSSYSCSVGHKQFGRTNVILKALSIYSPRNVSITCSASPNNHRRIPASSRQRQGSSRGKNWQYKERENSESPGESDQLPSKNGSLLSLSANQRFSAVATPGKKEREIVELFRKVQAQLRERAAIKEEKKMEASQQVNQGERGTVDSLLKLLRRHSVIQGKKSSDSSEDEPDSSLKSDTVFTARPTSKFRRRSPVPRVKFQPVFSPEEVKEKDGGNDRDQEVVADEVPDSSDTEIRNECVEEVSAAESSDLASLKLGELRGLAKSRGVKGYSKLKKGELLEILSGDCA